MKKVLLAGTALVSVAAMATPARADLKLDLGGYFRGYAVYADNQELTGAGGGASLQKFAFQKDAEVHFTGETTTDMGLTVGAHFELKMLGTNSFFSNTGTQQLGPGTVSANATGFQPTGSMVDESYIYFSGGWGRVNFGAEDGPAYLLQVAAPSADSNIDGLRPTIQGFQSDVWDDKQVDGTWLNPYSAGNQTSNYLLGYDNADFRHTDRLTYLTPKWNGFQAGVSYAPTQGLQGIGQNTMPISTQTLTPNYKNLWEGSARWDGEFQGFGVSLGGGYSGATHTETGLGAGTFGGANMETLDAGLNLTWQGFSLGGALKWSNTGVSGPSHDLKVWDVGLGWDNGPWHAGASWYDARFDKNAYGGSMFTQSGTGQLKLDRYTVGGGYTYGPGMSFRGAVAWMNTKESGAGAVSTNPVQITLGTDINF